MARITRMTKRRLGELLQAEGLIDDGQVRAGLDLQRKENLFLGEALVKLGFVSEEAIAHTIVQQFSLPFLSANQCNVPVDVLNIFPERMYYEYQFIAVQKIGKVLLICGAGLMNHDVLDELERLSCCKVCQYVSTWKDIRSALDKYAKDLRKEQSEMTDLGAMLLDGPAAPAASVAASPASVAAAPAPVAVAPRPAAPSVPAAVLKPATSANLAAVKPAARASASAAALPKTNGSGVPARGPATQGIPKSALSGPGSQRLSALKPGATAAPNVAAQPSKDKDGVPAAPKPGLLGLFKKP